MRIALCLALVLTGCTRKSGGDETRQAKQAAEPAGDTFVFAISGEPETLDPGKIRGTIEVQIVVNLVEGLVEYPLGNGAPVPAVAERWEVSPDGRTYTFHLREDARWTNGDPVTAADFRYAWLRVLDPKFASPNADKAFVIEGAQAYGRGEGAAEDVGVEVVDARTLRVRLAYVAPYFLELLAFPTFRPVHRATVEAHGDRWTRPEHLVSNGPFRLAEWRPGARLVLEKSPTHWDAKNVALDRVVVLTVQDNSTMLSLYESGELDWTGKVDLPATQMAHLSRRDDYHEVPHNGTYYYQLNADDPALKDPRVRRALSLTVERDAIAKVVKGGVVPAKAYVPPAPGESGAPGQHGRQRAVGVDFDPPAAQKLLAEAGFPKGEGLPRLQLLYNISENHKLVAEVVQRQWLQHLGVRVELQNQEWKVYLTQKHAQQYQVARAGWIGIFSDPMAFLDRFTSAHAQNDTGWSDAEYDRLIAAAKQEPDVAKRAELLRRAERLLVTEATVIPVYHYTSSYLLRPSVAGFAPNLLGVHPARYIRKKG